MDPCNEDQVVRIPAEVAGEKQTQGCVRDRIAMAVRIALGASSGSVLRMVLSQAVWLTCVGLAVGLVLSLALTRSASSLLYELKPHDPVTIAAAP